MQPNQIKKTWWLLLLVLAALSASSLVPAFELLGWQYKPVSLLSDLRQEIIPEQLTELQDTATLVLDSVVTEVQPTEKPLYPCPPGKVCIEDFSKDKSTLKGFFRALRQSKHSPVRIAFYGDSFIEGDVLCGSFRDTLQLLYGGTGVGFVPIASEVAQYRVSVQHTYTNWEAYSLVGKKSEAIELGISGHAFVPLPANEVEFKPARRPANSRFHQTGIFFKSRTENKIHYRVNDTLAFSSVLPPSDSVQYLSLPLTQAASLKISFENTDSLVVYGINFDNKNGVYVDNFAMRGNSGIGLAALDTACVQQFNHYLNYKLIFLQYGLNVVTETDSTDYGWYKARMIKVVNRLKALFPGTGIILIGISDRAANLNGKIQTLPAIARMRSAQRQIAQRTQIAYWDLFEAMGGENSIVTFAEAKPALAAKDYTHLTFLGGRRLAKKLTDALLFEQTRYDKNANP
ncbi:MAG: hypothetical protein KF775_02545 [Cyclobacteriaceae bacterium]|nr:hypothetical protein [Cyclobacteriaceae bacterium]